VTVPIKEYIKLPIYILKIKEFCEKHDERYQMFCKSHDSPCCRKCTIENHKECKQVVIIEDIIEDVKTSVSFDDLQQQLSVISKNIKRIRENRLTNADLIRKQKEGVEKDIRDLRETMNNHLDKLQEKLTTELIQVEVKTNNGIQELLTTLQRKEEEIYQSQINIENIKKYASELQSFLGLKQIPGISMKNENYIQSLIEDDNLKQIKLSFKADDQILNLFNNVNSFGKIIIETKSSDVDIEAYKLNQAQQSVVSIPMKSVNDVMLKRRQRIKTDLANVIGCCILSNGKMVFVNYYPGEVIVVRKDGSKDFTINIRSGNPLDVTCIDSNTIAVSIIDKDNQVHIIDLNKRSITRRIKIKSTVWGIAYNDGSLICCTEEEGLIRIDLKDNSITPVVRCSLLTWSHVTTHGNNIYYTNDTTHTVTSCDINGKVQWEFYDENVLVSPTGITTDNNNNIYVVSEGSNSLVVISPDGQNYKVLLSDRDELNLPWTIYCDRASNQLLLTNRRDDNGLLYDISTTPT
jgi:DNA-binding beta-propeller fold protein YncE